MARSDEEALMIDYEEAKSYADDYIEPFQNQIIKRGLILNGAIHEFNSFLNLPADSNATSAIFLAAFELISTLVPALRLGKFIATHHERATIALNAAEAFGRTAKRSDKVVKGVTDGLQKVGKLGEHGKEVKEVAEKGAALGKTLSAESETLKKHASRAPIKALIKDLDDGTALWAKAKAAVRQEWKNRVDDLKPQGGSLLGQMQSLLPALPATYSESELDEIWTLYLLLMVNEHCRENVYWEKRVLPYGMSAQTELKGLNKKQREQIVQWFVIDATRGKIFNKLIIDINWFLAQVPVQTKTIVVPAPSRVA